MSVVDRALSLLFLALTLVALGCEPHVEGEQPFGDDGPAFVLAGTDVLDALDEDGVSSRIDAGAPFERLGVLFHNAAPLSVEVRTSVDGDRFSAWAPVTLVHQEEGLRAGYVDPALTPSHFFQWRVIDGEIAPTWLRFEPIELLLMEAGDPGADEGLDLAPPDEEEQGLGAPHIQSRAAWGASAPRCSSSTSFYRATFHHTAGPVDDGDNTKALLRGIQAYHMNARGFCDIAYNYVVSRDGGIWTGRGDKQGGHVYNENHGNAGICYLGTYTSLQPTPDQLCAGASMLAWLNGRYPALKLDGNHVKGHRQYGAMGGGTSCPGDKVYAAIGSMINDAKQGGCAASGGGDAAEKRAAKEAALMGHRYGAGAGGDIDGDGRADVCARRKNTVTCFLARDQGLTKKVDGPDLSDERFSERSRWSTLRLADVTGDGRADLCVRGGAGFRCWPSTGTGFSKPITSDRMSGKRWDDPALYTTIRMGDVDGDGRADLCGRDRGGFGCWLAHDNGFGPRVSGPEWSNKKGWDQPWRYGSIRMGDVDGDGRADVCGLNANGVVCFRSDGASLSRKMVGPRLERDAGWDELSRWSTLRLVDVDGDGRDDLCGRFKQRFRCRLSSGNGFGAASGGPLMKEPAFLKAEHAATIRMGDVDGDGDLDVCARRDGGVRCHLWNGSGFSGGFLAQRFGDEQGGTKASRYRTLDLADVDGDGTADLCGRNGSGLRCWRGTGSDFVGQLSGPDWSDARGWDAALRFGSIRFAGDAG